LKSLTLIFSNFRYFAPAFIFATLNVVIGTWAIYIPTIKTKLAIDEGDLGLALFCMALGTLTMILFAPKIIGRFGVGRATAYGLFVFLFTFIIPFATTNYIGLCVGLYIVGAFSGFTDVAMNTLVTEIEKQDAIHIMSANHGFFSLGGFLGAGIGSFFLPLQLVPLHYLLVVIAILLVVNLLLLKYYINISSNDQEAPSFNIKIGLGYTVFSITMAIARFLGDDISRKFGSKVLIIGGSLIGSIGFSCVLLVEPVLAIIGFGLVGVGLSVIIPELFRLGGKTAGVESSQGISFISGVGFFGFLVGPVLLGFLADMSSLKLSFFFLTGFVFVSFLLAFRLKR